MQGAGAFGAVPVDIDDEALKYSVTKTAEGKPTFTASQLTRMDVWRRDVLHRLPRLTEQEQAVLSQLVNFESPVTIASNLGISRDTVYSHKRRIHAKYASQDHFDLLGFLSQEHMDYLHS